MGEKFCFDSPMKSFASTRCELVRYYLKILAIIFLILSGNTDLFKLVEYTIESFSEKPLGDKVKIGDGFIHQADTTRFEIKGTIQNIADYEADLDLFLKFYDKNDNLLQNRKFNINNLEPEEIRGFYDAVILNTHDYFPYVEKMALEFVED